VTIPSKIVSLSAASRQDSRLEIRQKGELFGADERVYQAVLGAVMAHRLPPGTKLIEAVLSDAMGLPRAVVRMGLLRLAHDQIVELRPNRGAAVASPSLDDARHVYDARRLIEGALAERLCGRLAKASLAELRRNVAEGLNAFKREDTAAWITLAGRFHVRLAELSGNPVVARQVRELVSRSNLITALYLLEGSTVYSSDDRHELLLLLASSAPSAPRRAKASMERLLRTVEERLQVRPPSQEDVDLRGIFFEYLPDGISNRS
jgi:DNA-binding GntR family transcriptional regulator